MKYIFNFSSDDALFLALLSLLLAPYLQKPFHYLCYQMIILAQLLYAKIADLFHPNIVISFNVPNAPNTIKNDIVLESKRISQMILSKPSNDNYFYLLLLERLRAKFLKLRKEDIILNAESKNNCFSTFHIGPNELYFYLNNVMYSELSFEWRDIFCNFLTSKERYDKAIFYKMFTKILFSVPHFLIKNIYSNKEKKEAGFFLKFLMTNGVIDQDYNIGLGIYQKIDDLKRIAKLLKETE